MKKLITILIAICLSSVCLFAASYTSNQYQKLARDYTAKAQEAFDSGEYDLAIEYSQKAEENAELSRAYIATMLARADAEKQIRLASNRLVYVKSIQGDVYYPMAYTAGEQHLTNAKNAFSSEQYESASSFARQALDVLAGITETTPLPKYYVVRPWAESKDCYWNISGRSFVYNDPTMWENLYQANKQNMKDPANPNLILPGMKMEIPSINGEAREGTYSPDQRYDTFSANR